MHAGAYSNWEGIAPGAKIAFQDLGNDNTGTLSVPYDLFYDYFPFSYQWYASASCNPFKTHLKTLKMHLGRPNICSMKEQAIKHPGCSCPCAVEETCRFKMHGKINIS